MNLSIPPALHHIFSPEDLKATLESLDSLSNTCSHYGPGGDIAIGSDFDKELRQQFISYLVIGDALASAKTTADAINLALDSIMSLTELRTREAFEDDDATTMPFPISGMSLPKMGKSTEGVIRATVDSYDIVRGMKELHNQASFFVNKLNNMKDAWLQRSIMLRSLVERELQTFMSGSTMSSSEAITAELGRRRMAEERKKS